MANWLILLACLTLVSTRVNAADNNASDKSASKSQEAAKPATFMQAKTLAELLALPSEQLEKVDIARMNLLCAEGLRGSENLDVQQNLDTLESWKQHVEDETTRNYHRFLEHPEAYQNSQSYYRMAMLAMVLQEDFNTHYDPERAMPQILGKREPNDVFFADSKDVFIHGLLGGERHGTCSSLPVIYAAVAQRLGYPVNLASAEEHLYLRYEEGTNHLNVDAAGEGFITHSDDEYKMWPHPITEKEIKTYGFLQPMSHKQILGAFLSIRAANLTSAKRFDGAAQAWEAVSRYLPSTPVLERIVARAKERAENVHKADRWDELWDQVLMQPIPDREPKTQYFLDKQAQLLLYMNSNTDVAAIEQAATGLKNEVDDYVKSITTDMHQVQFRIALKPPPMPQMQAAMPDNSPEMAAMSPLPQKIQIPAERVPPEFWKSIPPDLQQRLNEVNGVGQIISEMWAYHAEQINAQNRQMMTPPSGQPAQTQDWHAQLEADNARKREEAKALLLNSYTPGTPNSPLTKPLVRIEIIAPRAGEP
jgi:hypothetical protein